MVVSVEFFGVQRALTQTHEIQVPLFEEGRVRDVILYLRDCYPNLPLGKKDVHVTVNNKISSTNHYLRSNDKIAFLPHIGGG